MAEESALEKDCKEFAEGHGWLFWKFVSPGLRGVPDRFMARRGRVVFVEFKARGETPTRQQVNRQLELEGQGIEVYWVDNFEDFSAIAD